MKINDSFEKDLNAIDKVSKRGHLVTNKALYNELSVSFDAVIRKYFNRNTLIMKKYVKIDKSKRATIYSLTNKGAEAISLIQYFKDHYKSI